MQEILKKVQINMPYQMLVDKYLPLVIKARINPEIGFNCFVLDRYSQKQFKDVAHILHDAGVNITMHGPFYDLRPGALDKKIRQVTVDRFYQTFDLVPYFKPRTVVFHAAFEEKYYFSHEERWLENSIDTWHQFVVLAAELNTIIALENVYEKSPVFLGRLLDCFEQSSQICCCLDTGHFNAFSNRNFQEWANILGHHIGQLHLHDNDGSADQHMPLGEGTFPFHDLCAALQGQKRDLIITLEPHNEKNLWKMLENPKLMNFLNCLQDRVKQW